MSAVRRDEGAWTFAPFVVYRALSAGSTHRRCRLHPTCSLFTVQAMRRFGALRGGLMGLARAQMQHDNHFGLLPTRVASDGYFVHDDPVSNWETLR